MDKLKMHTPDKTKENFEKLAALFPNAVTDTIVDGEVVRAIDADVLRQEISATVVKGNEERYQFTWPDKKKSVLLDLGVLLSSKIEERVIGGKKVFNVVGNFLIACFDDNVTEETVKAIAQQKPYYAVFRDSSYDSDSVAANFEQIFATYSPNTTRKVL